jgi:purine catabolism regulator
MAKAKAVSDAEKRLRGSFLERLLQGDISQQEMNRQGERFEHDMKRPHLAIVLAWYGSERTPSLRRLETIVNSVVNAQQVDTLVWLHERENKVLVFHSVDDKDPVGASMKLARAFATELHQAVANAKVAIGLGQVASDLQSWRHSYRDAVQALELAERLQTDAPLYIGDLGVYQLILNLRERDLLKAFCDRTLGALVDYDMKQHADLLKTLEAFFQCHGNLSETAKLLIVHRNTLLYRMNRINEIAQIDLERPETRLALHMALTIRRLLNDE